MTVLIDADGCPVVDIAVRVCQRHNVRCMILCDSAHTFQRQGAETLVFDKGADSVDIALVNRASPGDVVITQDYGLASMALARRAYVLHQDGWQYTADNIDALLHQRHEARKHRAAGRRFKGPSKRTASQDEAFCQALDVLLNKLQG